MQFNRFGIKFGVCLLGLMLGLLARAGVDPSPDPSGDLPGGAQPEGAVCGLMLAKPLILQAREWQFQKSVISTEVDFSPVESAHPESIKLLKELEAEGAHAEIVLMKRRLRFVGFGETEADRRASVAKAWKEFKYDHPTTSQGFNLEDAKGNMIWATAEHEVVRLISLPSRFPTELHIAFQSLVGRHFEIVAGHGMQIPWYAMGKTMAARQRDPTTTSGVILVRANLLTAVSLMHEIQGAMDMVLETEKFLDSIPSVPSELQEVVNRVQSRRHPWEVSEIDNARHDAILKMTADLWHIHGSEVALKQLLNKENAWRLFFSRGGLKEALAVWHEVFRYSYAHLRLLYHMLYVNPKDPNNAIYFAKLAASGYLWTKSVILVANGLTYMISAVSH